MPFQMLRDYKTSGFVLLHASQNAFMILHPSQDCTHISLPQHVFAYFAKTLSVSCLGSRYQREYKYKQLRNKTFVLQSEISSDKSKCTTVPQRFASQFQKPFAACFLFCRFSLVVCFQQESAVLVRMTLRFSVRNHSLQTQQLLFQLLCSHTFYHTAKRPHAEILKFRF